MNDINTLGIYIHIPFCDGKCNYCDFFSFKATQALLDEYTDILISKVKIQGERFKDRITDTVYFGGGTPSLLGTERILKIIDAVNNSFNVSSDAEVTLEVNPSSGNTLNYSMLAYNGINRISIGMQSANENELKLLGRRHSVNDVIITRDNILKSNISNISVDVMLGIPKQTSQSLIETLEFCTRLDITHISTYMLTIEPNTFFGKNYHKFSFADDDTQSDLYLLTSEYLKSKGFEHYEISNFCIANKKSRHNMRYWQLNDYLGLGPSAHSLINGKRSYYPLSIKDFKNDITVDDGVGGTKEEYIMLMLRTDIGIEFKEYEKKFNNKLSISFLNKVKFYEKLGYIESDDNRVRLTKKGFLISNTIIADLI